MPLTIEVNKSIEDAKSAVVAALAARGFGILTEIDVAGTLKTKIGVERAPLLVLGACNPKMANEALNAEPGFALVLPCNVVLEDTGSSTKISIADPRTLIDSPQLEKLASEAAELLTEALESIR